MADGGLSWLSRGVESGIWCAGGGAGAPAAMEDAPGKGWLRLYGGCCWGAAGGGGGGG